MIKLDKERVVYCDCDDTLIIWEPEKYSHISEDLVIYTDDYGQWIFLKHNRNIEFLKRLKQQGYGVVIWSAAGAEWASKVTKLLGLEEVADFVMAKPEICIDDLLDPKRIIKSVVWINPEDGVYKRNE